MYRAYEDPYKIQVLLDEARADYDKAVERGADDEELIDLAEWINGLEERLNHAWQDDEAEQFGYDY